MPLPLEDIINIIIENTRKRLSPVPIPPEAAYGWAEGLDIPRGGDTVLYTGLLYQLVPYINSMVKYLEKFESKGGILVKLGRVASKVVDFTKFISVSKEDIERQHNIIRSIVLLLRKFGINFGYLYDDELYSGVLLYDLGLDEIFKEHAMKVYERFRKYGVKKVITIDPHTTYIVRRVYPSAISGFDVKVENYLEILYRINPKPVKLVNNKVVIHDPCYYTRFEKIIEPPRKLLENAGIEVLEPKRSRELTFCCGGPIESISPKLSSAIARKRFIELSSLSNEIIVMCPICYSNLSRVADNAEIKDISLLLSEAYGGE